MQIKVCSQNFVPRILGVSAITLYPYILIAEEKFSLELITHEMIHVEQVRKEGIAKFYTKYLYFYIKNRISGMSHRHAYTQIPYEVEAYKSQNRLLTAAETKEIYGDKKTG